jgi:hypothetical protein
MKEGLRSRDGRGGRNILDVWLLGYPYVHSEGRRVGIALRG